MRRNDTRFSPTPKSTVAGMASTRGRVGVGLGSELHAIASSGTASNAAMVDENRNRDRFIGWAGLGDAPIRTEREGKNTEQV